MNELEVCGDDLLAIGFKPGQLLGNTLNKLLKLVREGRILNDKETLTEFAKLDLGEV